MNEKDEGKAPVFVNLGRAFASDERETRALNRGGRTSGRVASPAFGVRRYRYFG